MKKTKNAASGSSEATERQLSRRKLLKASGLASLGALPGMLLGQNGLAQTVEAPAPLDYEVPPVGVIPEDATIDRSFRITSQEAPVVIDEGVVYQGMTFDRSIPSSLHVMNEGETVEVEIANEGLVTHGLSYHPVYRSTPPNVGTVAPGQTKSEIFRAVYPGVFMYHCAPGGQGIPIHTLGGMYGMAVVEPTTQRYRLEEALGREPDVKVYLTQHELYASGKDMAEGKPLYTMFNGYNYRYVENPIQVRPGDYVRLYYLNVGPSIPATLHAVGLIWDFMYYQGNPNNVFVGGQSVFAGPTDSWVIEFRIPEEGPYPLVSHAFGTQTMRGALGLFLASEDAEVEPVVGGAGPILPLPEDPLRVVNPFAPGSEHLDPIWTQRPGEDVLVKMIGNSFWPKTVRVAPGTPITWINEDVFDYLGGDLVGEESGQHNVVVSEGPEIFAGPMLAHAQTWSQVFVEPGEYEYFCALHPYMRGRVIVDPALAL